MGENGQVGEGKKKKKKKLIEPMKCYIAPGQGKETRALVDLLGSCPTILGRWLSPFLFSFPSIPIICKLVRELG